LFNPRTATAAACHAFAIGLFQFAVPLLILLANSRRGSFGRNVGKLEHAGEANPVRLAPRAEFANSIQ
jgi:hypothetical protein